ncbi:hypothetical protein MTsPCn5_09770 [Croceitalea sp. MTPC5]|uniref:saccharopine dehydrogenase NADP-binding domain-containing protein n=1 Tax=Croceitalea sp. MTPC5 TaxID=3056565 RepID=UPI002B39716D|nr:hypothetical protein MTsPCn5_09770 [Croceitalea sp. MTPC5]
MKARDKILIIGGYGTVGSLVSAQLAKRYPSKIIIAGRNKTKAEALIGEHRLAARAIYMDIEKEDFREVNFEELHTVINCLETDNISFLLDCINLDINYTEVGASYESHRRFFEIADYINNSYSLVVPSVGLIPGLSNVLAYNGARTFDRVEEIHNYIMLGLGESHGIDSIRWMLKKAGSTFEIKAKTGKVRVKGFTHPKSTFLLNEDKKRTFYLFDFSDHHIIPLFIETKAMDTRIGFDSRMVSKLFFLLQKMGILKWCEQIDPRRLKKVLDLMGLGSNQYALQVEIKGTDKKQNPLTLKYLASGRNEALATASVTSFIADLLYTNRTLNGLKHIEEICDWGELKRYMEKQKITIINEETYENNIVQSSRKSGAHRIIG